MTTRRRFLVSLPVIAASSATLASCSSSMSYATAEDATWRSFDPTLVGRPAIVRELIRYATLAPSSHNTQCWIFKPDPSGITIQPDFSRRCSAVDPDDHHLFVSLGCATENLVQAAAAHGFAAHVRFNPAGGGSVRVGLESGNVTASTMFAAIPHRQSTRSLYDGTSIATADLAALEGAGSGTGVRVILQTARPRIEHILERVVAANTVQMNDPAFMRELRSWIRFSDRAAVTTGDGLYSRASGSPAIPQWLGKAIFPYVFTSRTEDDRYARSIRSSAGVAVFVSQVSDRAHWVEAGRCFERFALTATVLGVRTAMLNQPVEVAAMRDPFAAALGLAGRVDLVVRFGHAPAMPRSLRRPVAAVIA